MHTHTHTPSESNKTHILFKNIQNIVQDGLYSPWNSPGQNTGVGNLSLLQGIFPTQGLNPGLPHCRRILYQRNYKASPSTLEWVAYPFPGMEPESPALQAGSLPTKP